MEYTKEDLEREINATVEVNEELKSKLGTFLEDLDKKAAADGLTGEDVAFMEDISAKLTVAAKQLDEIRNIILSEE